MTAPLGVEGFGDPGFDFWGYYVPAGRALASGGTPYSLSGYVYSPLIAALVWLHAARLLDPTRRWRTSVARRSQRRWSWRSGSWRTGCSTRAAPATCSP
jgi:hypothetical protein